MKEVVIGITDCSKYPAYEKWIISEPGVKVIKLSYRANNLDDVQNCDGLLFTGGEDVHPRFYSKPEYLPMCDQKAIDEKRDEFEMNVMQYGLEEQLPLLGICRGLQIANVFYGGTLIPDIPSSGKSNHSKIEEGNDRYHPVLVDPNSLLKKIVGIERGEVNSAHHQSADIIGNGLVVNAISEDGVIEGLERKEPAGKPFLLLVQWHPERIRMPESVFSKNIKESFLAAVRDAGKVDLLNGLNG